jgi:D-alanine--poly(phosphoribitol) ligase subunit 2
MKPPETPNGCGPDVALRERIARVFSDVLSVDVPGTDTDLFGMGVLDSLAFVELLVQLEREFGVTTSAVDLEIDNFNSIAGIASYVSARTATTSDTFAHSRIVRLGT